MSRNATVLVAARRTPIGSLNGGVSAISGHELGAAAIRAALADIRLSGDEIDETILGQVLTAGQGMNPARQAARLAGVADSAPAALINQVCGSGLRAVILAHQQIETGSAKIVVAGGQESMSNAPHVALVRPGRKLGDVVLRDTIVSEGVSDAFYGYPMGETAENIAHQYSIAREVQEAFALASHQKASAASRSGRFSAEIVPIQTPSRKGPVTIDADEHVRHDASLEAMAKLRPAYRSDGTVTAATASGMNDGAAALVMMSEEEASRRNLTPLARIVAWAHAGVDPQVMGLGPIPASRKALARAGWSSDQVPLWELNEAFAAQTLAVINELGLDPERVNVNGGAIALGHPIGASGGRILVTLLHEMGKRDVKRGVAALCIGGGMGIALAVERD